MDGGVAGWASDRADSLTLPPDQLRRRRHRRFDESDARDGYLVHTAGGLVCGCRRGRAREEVGQAGEQEHVHRCESICPHGFTHAVD